MIISSLAFPLLVALICAAIFWLERPVIDADLIFIASPYLMFIFPFPTIFGYFMGTMVWHVAEDRFYAAKYPDEIWWSDRDCDEAE